MLMTLRVEISNEINESEWNRALAKSSFSTAFQVASYFKPDQIAFNSKQFFIKVLDNSGEIVGQLSVILNLKDNRRTENPISNYLINHLNLGSSLIWNMGPIIHDKENHDKICSQIFQSIDRLCHDYHIEKIKGSTPPLDPYFSKKIFSDANFLITPWKTYIIDLPTDANEYFESLPKKVRYDIRKSQKNDLTFEIAKSLEDLNEFAMLKYRNRKNPKEIIERGQKGISSTWDILFKNNFRIIFLAKHKGEIVAGINAALFNKIIYFSSIVNSKKNLQSGSFLIWNSIKWAIEHQYSLLDMGGANPSPNSQKEKQIDFYKSKWNGNEYKNYHLLKIFSKKRSKFSSFLRRL